MPDLVPPASAFATVWSDVWAARRFALESSTAAVRANLCLQTAGFAVWLRASQDFPRTVVVERSGQMETARVVDREQPACVVGLQDLAARSAGEVERIGELD